MQEQRAVVARRGPHAPAGDIAALMIGREAGLVEDTQPLGERPLAARADDVGEDAALAVHLGAIDGAGAEVAIERDVDGSPPLPRLQAHGRHPTRSSRRPSHSITVVVTALPRAR